MKLIRKMPEVIHVVISEQYDIEYQRLFYYRQGTYLVVELKRSSGVVLFQYRDFSARSLQRRPMTRYSCKVL